MIRLSIICCYEIMVADEQKKIKAIEDIVGGLNV